MNNELIFNKQPKEEISINNFNNNIKKFINLNNNNIKKIDYKIENNNKNNNNNNINNNINNNNNEEKLYWSIVVTPEKIGKIIKITFLPIPPLISKFYFPKLIEISAVSLSCFILILFFLNLINFFSFIYLLISIIYI